MKVIKRYSNRRLYDTDHSRTITQADLATMVKEGEQLKVVDNTSGRDVTLAVFGRVLLTEASSWEDKSQTKELLRKIISYGGDESMSVLKNTILASIGAYHVTRAKAEEIIDDLIEKGDLDKSDRKKAVIEMLDKAEESTTKWKDKISKGADKTGQEITKLVKNLNLAKRTDLKKVEAKVDKLAKALKSLEKKIDSM
ncbi:MAG: phasin family protein [candidate division Zixibacteria bacterium]|nr:phasin family protein [candidate division Zixibacteria bacterium]